MIKYSPFPNGGRVSMTGNAVRRKARPLMIGILGRVIVLLMAGHTLGGQAGKLPTHMTVAALSTLMLTFQHEARMVNHGTFPGSRCISMTTLAVRWESSGLMIRILCSIVVGLMASHTV